MSDDAFANALDGLGPALLSGLAALERTRRRLHPPELPSLLAQHTSLGIGLVLDYLALALKAWRDIFTTELIPSLSLPIPSLGSPNDSPRFRIP